MTPVLYSKSMSGNEADTLTEFMKEALLEAETAERIGEVPVGAVAVATGR